MAPATPVAASTAGPAGSAPAAGATPPSAPAAPVRPSPDRWSQKDYVSPLNNLKARPVQMGGAKPSTPPGAGDARKPRPQDGPKTNIRKPSVNLAPMPAIKPQAPVKSNEPAPQQPIIRLPASVLAARGTSRTGSNPLNEFVKQAEADRKAGIDRKPGGPPGSGGRPRPGAPPAPAAAPAAGVGVGRKKKGRPGEEDEEAAEAARRKAKPSHRRRARRDEEGGGTGGTRRLIRKKGNVSTAAPRKSGIVIELPTTVRAFCEAAGIPAAKLLKKLMDLKVAANINAWLDDESAEFLAAEFGVEAEFKRASDLEEELIGGYEEEVDSEEDLQIRPPVITFLGHVDHGKTSLLDKIIGINVQSGESGGITQHIRAYKIEHNGHPIAFVDTPGHEAFTEMRARGANVTDIAVLVVAADDGVMPQTEEALNHARAAGVPIVVALNKTDLPYNKDKIYQQLASVDLLPAEWGGEVEVVPCSALTGKGIPELLETILTLAELHILRANPDRAASGTCLESRQDGDRGVVAKVIVQNGTLRIGDVIVCGSSYGRVKAMYNPLKPREQLEEAGPSTPVDLTGFDEAPLGGDAFHVLEDITAAREIAEQREAIRRNEELGPAKRGITLEGFQEKLGQKAKTNLNLIIRADTRGSIEAIKKELTKLENPEVEVRVLQGMVGTVTEADVYLADAAQAIIIAFNVVPDDKASSIAKARGIEVRRYEVIYEITEQVR
ncbi:MAG TPA: translation initiation factor IF-2, partial [Pirellulales bacterium]